MLPALHRRHATAQIVGDLLPRFETDASVIVGGRLDRRRIRKTAIAIHFDGWFLAHSSHFTPSLPTRSGPGSQNKPAVADRGNTIWLHSMVGVFWRLPNLKGVPRLSIQAHYHT